MSQMVSADPSLKLLLSACTLSYDPKLPPLPKSLSLFSTSLGRQSFREWIQWVSWVKLSLWEGLRGSVYFGEDAAVLCILGSVRIRGCWISPCGTHSPFQILLHQSSSQTLEFSDEHTMTQGGGCRLSLVQNGYIRPGKPEPLQKGSGTSCTHVLWSWVWALLGVQGTVNRWNNRWMLLSVWLNEPSQL